MLQPVPTISPPFNGHGLCLRESLPQMLIFTYSQSTQKDAWVAGFLPLLKFVCLTSNCAGQPFVKISRSIPTQFNILTIAGRRIIAVTWFAEISRQSQAKEVGIIPPHYLQTIILFRFEHATYQMFGQWWLICIKFVLNSKNLYWLKSGHTLKARYSMAIGDGDHKNKHGVY